MNSHMITAILVSFLVTVICGPVLIPWLRKLKFGQQILEDGPSWHEKKNGTPTMGGIMFIIGITVSVIAALFAEFDIKLLTMLLVSLGFGAIGFIDDYTKVVMKRNMGLTAAQKFGLQAILTVVYILAMKYTNSLTNELIIPFAGKTVMIPWWLYTVLIMCVVCGTVNAVNLTDGIDGLAAGITVVVGMFFAIAALYVKEENAAYFSFAVAGGCIGFFLFNKNPAKVFMGDTGSLFLGGAVACAAVGLKMPLILVIAGFVYLFETLSVMIQVISFKTRGKRVFKMTPIHHHFEMCGWNEWKIDIVFSGISLILCIIAFLSLMPAV